MTVTVGHPPAAGVADVADEELSAITVALTLATAPGTVEIVQGPGLLCGWALRETSGVGSAVIDFFDGDATGQLLGATVITASGAAPFNVGHDGVRFLAGLTAVVSGATVRGAVYARIRRGAS